MPWTFNRHADESTHSLQQDLDNAKWGAANTDNPRAAEEKRALVAELREELVGRGVDLSEL